MREAKKRSLRAKGWRFGTTTEFLGLSAEETAYVDMRLRLADGLRSRRTRRHLTQSDAARTVHSSQSRMAKMEAGDPTVSLDLLIRALLALGASQREVAHLVSGSARQRAA